MEGHNPDTPISRRQGKGIIRRQDARLADTNSRFGLSDVQISATRRLVTNRLIEEGDGQDLVHISHHGHGQDLGTHSALPSELPEDYAGLNGVGRSRSRREPESHRKTISPNFNLHSARQSPKYAAPHPITGHQIVNEERKTTTTRRTEEPSSFSHNAHRCLIPNTENLERRRGEVLYRYC